jgi:D-alanyl-D-alanine carboxypeptidase
MRAIAPALMIVAFCTTSVLGQERPSPFDPAFLRIDDFVANEMYRSGTPGVALALTNRNALLRVSTYGYRDVKNAIPVGAETLFQIGSISKAFTSIALLRLRDEGQFDVHRAVVEYLPWLGINRYLEPVTAHHLLTHTAGLPRDGDLLGLVELLRNFRPEHEPGDRSVYSNVGYQILGYLLEDLTGQAYGEAIRRLVFEPLGVVASDPVITYDTRTRAAIGYVRPQDRPEAALMEAPWFEYRLGDGSIAATAEDVATFLRMLLNRGHAPTGRVISDESFSMLAQMTVPAHGPDDGLYSGYGIAVQSTEGLTLLWHRGGMPGYTSMLIGDITNGLGVVVLTNGPGDTSRRVAEFALSALRDAMPVQDIGQKEN